jgi:hypothetical protein
MADKLPRSGVIPRAMSERRQIRGKDIFPYGTGTSPVSADGHQAETRFSVWPSYSFSVPPPTGSLHRIDGQRVRGFSTNRMRLSA